MCWDVSSLDAQAPVLLWGCHGSQGNQLWRYDPVGISFRIHFKIIISTNTIFFFSNKETLQLIHGGNPRCLDCDPGRKELYVATCNNESPTQRWTFERFNQTALLRWNKAGIDEV
jgi:polypeptide N-acetylgalactosaminyltransferase